MKPFAILLFLGAVLGACSSSPRPSERRSLPVVFKHTRDFMWEQIQEELKEHWYIAEADEAKGVVTTEWDVKLAPMGRQGRRFRIRVFLEGKDGEGYTVLAEEEAEENTNDKNPLSSAEAEWKPTATEGAKADQFLIGLARRLRPRMKWKEEMIR